MIKVKQERMQKWVKIELTKAINSSKKTILKTISINAVKISNDFKYATILWLSYQELKIADITVINNELENIKGYLRTWLAKVSSTYTVPELRFKYDDTLDKVARLENIFRKFNNHENE